MELVQLRCFLAVAQELHFGRAARRMDMLPASLGRHVKMLEDGLGTKLISRTTRHASLTEAGSDLLEEARHLVTMADRFEEKARNAYREQATILRIGAIDSAAIGLVPQLLNAFRQSDPDIDVTLYEQKTIRLLPRLLSGRLDLVFIRKPETLNSKIRSQHLLSETAVVTVAEGHRFVDRDSLTVEDLVGEPLIVPERQSRPHSHDLTMKLFADAGLTARVAQIAGEKQTIVNMVSNGLGLAIVPRWSSRMSIQGVRYIPLMTKSGGAIRRLDLSAAWVRNTRDPVRDKLMACVNANLEEVSRFA